MKRMLIIIMTFVGLFAQAGVTISNVKVSPISPMGMYLSYDVAGTLPSNSSEYILNVVISNRITHYQRDISNALNGDVLLFKGGHRVYYDACGVDHVTLDISQCVALLDYRLAQYCVIDISGGATATRYQVKYLATIPVGGWSDDYKTNKLVLKRINAGSFMMQGAGNTTLSKDFFIGVFAVTKQQWENVMGCGPYNGGWYLDANRGGTTPATYITYDLVRGSDQGANWPKSSAVDTESFLGKLRSRSGLGNLDLPTEAQWEYACRAGTTTVYSYGNSENGDYMWYAVNSGLGSKWASDRAQQPVGGRQPNPWGLYDMHGNVFEWCLDWYDYTLAYGLNPKGPQSSSWSTRVIRGGYYESDANECTSSYRGTCYPYRPKTSDYTYRVGLRLCRPLQ